MTVRQATFAELDAVKKQLVTLEKRLDEFVPRLNTLFTSAARSDERLRATMVAMTEVTRRTERIDIRSMRRLEEFDWEMIQRTMATVSSLKEALEKLAARVAKLQR